MKTSILSLVALALLALVGCEDTPPTTYVPQYVLQGYLTVDEPIQGIKVTLTQPTTEVYQYRNSAVTDAQVDILVDGQRLHLLYRPDSLVGEYYYPDTTVRVQPGTVYGIEIHAADGAVVTAETKTPSRIAWTKPPRDTIQYPPSDTVRPPDSLSLSWSAAPETEEYLISVRSLDTVQYGRYLRPPTREPNVRIARPFEENAPDYKDVTRWGFLQGTRTPLVWAAFKWYGLQEVTVYAPDPNFLDWFKMTQFAQNPQYDTRLGSVKGGVGVFASAAIARKRVFVLKKRP